MSGQAGIYALLKANSDLWMNITDIANIKSTSDNADTAYCQVARQLNKMIKYPGIFEGLESKFIEERREKRTFNVKYYRVSSNVFK